MKKYLLILVMVFAMSGFMSLSAPAQASDVDQQNIANPMGSLAVKSHLLTIQTFRPALSKLGKVDVKLQNTSGTLNCGYEKYNGTDWDPIKFINDQAAIDGWNTFDFDDVDITVGARYRIWLEASTTATQWDYSSGNTYANGFAIWSSTDQPNKDFLFKTYGADTPAGGTDTPVDDDVTTATTIDTSAGEAPATTTSTTVKAASALKAEYNSADATVRLSWTKSSTTDIDGYKVYRSELATSGFKEIGKTNATTITYADSTVLTAGKTYYYLVRAYKTTAQSANSNTAEIIIPAAAATATTDTTATAKKHSPLSLVNVDINEDPIVVYLGMAAALLVLLLIAYQLFRYNRRHLLTAPDATFRLNKK